LTCIPTGLYYGIKEMRRMWETKDRMLRVRIARSVSDRIEWIAKEEGRNLSDIVREALIEWLIKREKEYAKSISFEGKS